MKNNVRQFYQNHCISCNFHPNESVKRDEKLVTNPIRIFQISKILPKNASIYDWIPNIHKQNIQMFLHSSITTLINIVNRHGSRQHPKLYIHKNQMQMFIFAWAPTRLHKYSIFSYFPSCFSIHVHLLLSLATLQAIWSNT